MRIAPLVLCMMFVAACGSSRKDSNSNLGKIPWGTKMQSPTVVFAYDQWTSDHKNVKDRAKKYEKPWKEEIRRAFVGATQLIGMGGDDVAVTITIVDMDPGSQAARAWVGWGAGKGFIKAHVEVAGYGDFNYEDEIKGGGWTGGRFEEVLHDLGTGIAGVIARNRERPQ